MSTKFGIKTDNGMIEEIAFRGNYKGVYFTNPIASMLPDELQVIPLDNSAQGIYTIGDIKREIKKEVDLNEEE